MGYGLKYGEQTRVDDTIGEFVAKDVYLCLALTSHCIC